MSILFLTTIFPLILASIDDPCWESLCVCLCVCVCARMCMYVCARTCAHTCVSVHPCMCVCVHVCACMHACVRARVCVCARACVRACVHVCVLSYSVMSSSLRPMDCRLPGFFVYSIFQANSCLQNSYWSAFPFSTPGDLLDPRIKTESWDSCTDRWILYQCITWETQ